MKLALSIMLLVLVLPSAAASELITITQNSIDATDGSVAEHKIFHNKNTESYVFSIPNPPFNYTAPFSANDSIWSFAIHGGFTDDHPFSISDTTRFAFSLNWNTTESATLAFDYIKHGWGSFAYWQTIYTVEYDGHLVCSFDSFHVNGFLNQVDTGFHTIGNSITPVPDVVFGPASWLGNTSRGSTAKQIYDSFAENNTQTERVLAYEMGDGIHGENDFCANPYIGGLKYLANFTALTGPVTLGITTSAPYTFDNIVGWEFENRTSDIFLTDGFFDGAANFTKQLGANYLCGAGSFFAFATCFVKETITGIISYTLGFIDTVFLGIFGLVPGGVALYNIIKFPIQFAIDMSLLFGKILFGAGPNYGPGGVLWNLFIYSIDIGLGLVCLTGRWENVYKAPGGFAYGMTIGVAKAAKFIYWDVPIKIVFVITQLVQVVRG